MRFNPGRCKNPPFLAQLSKTILVKNNRILNGEPDIDIHKLDELIKAHEKNRMAISKSFGAILYWGDFFTH